MRTGRTGHIEKEPEQDGQSGDRSWLSHRLTLPDHAHTPEIGTGSRGAMAPAPVRDEPFRAQARRDDRVATRFGPRENP